MDSSSELTLHLNKKDGKKLVEEFKFQAGQIFVTSGRASYAISPTNDWYKDNVKRLYVHASYVANPWSSVKSTNSLLKQMEECERIGAKGCVIHVNKRPIEEISSAVAEHEWKVPLLMEPTAVCPNVNSYESPDKLNALLVAIAKLKKCKPEELMKKHNIGLCLDSAHIFISKEDIKSYDNAKAWLDKLKYPGLVGLIHLNGADNLSDKTGKLTCKDKHNTPFYGYTVDGVHHPDQLWDSLKWDKSGCKAFFDFAKKYKLDLIREQGRGDLDDFKKFRKLALKHL